MRRMRRMIASTVATFLIPNKIQLLQRERKGKKRRKEREREKKRLFLEVGKTSKKIRGLRPRTPHN